MRPWSAKSKARTKSERTHAERPRRKLGRGGWRSMADRPLFYHFSIDTFRDGGYAGLIMAPAKKSLWPSAVGWLLIALVWIVTAWLLVPLISLDKVELRRSTEYFFRSAAGTVLMIIMFGKTIFDLLFPLDTSRRKNYLYVGLLTLYTVVLASGIIFMCLRILMVYLNANTSTFSGSDVQY